MVAPRRSRSRIILPPLAFALVLAFLLSAPTAQAIDALPYTKRTRGYSGSTGTVRGDVRTLGMAGATVGLGDTFIASTDNPAGLAMTLDTGDVTFTSNDIVDSHIQPGDAPPIGAKQYGAALALYPWGFHLGYTSPITEENTFAIPNSPPATLMVTHRELRMSAAYFFKPLEISIGGGLRFGQALRELEVLEVGATTQTFHSYTVGVTFGLLKRVANQFLFGLSYNSSMDYAAKTDSNFPASLPGFFNRVRTPYRIGLGAGWIPNRFLRGDFTLFLVGRTPGVALLRDDSVLVGDKLSLQPRLGFAYVFSDFHNLKGTAFMGTYLEFSRIEDSAPRPHVTSGIEVKPWIFTLGTGVDVSLGYRNFLVGLGVDLVKLFAELELIPPIPQPARQGWMPRADSYSTEGLPRPLTRGERSRRPGIDPVEVIKEIPHRVEEKLEQIRKMSNIEDNPDPRTTPTPSPTPAPAPIPTEAAGTTLAD